MPEIGNQASPNESSARLQQLGVPSRNPAAATRTSTHFLDNNLSEGHTSNPPSHNLPTPIQLTSIMANYLASIFGTEQDKVNCSFYYKIGASYSQTILLPNLYQNPAYDGKSRMTPAQLQNHFDAFYEDFWCEMCKFGEIEEVVVCDNNNDHLIGNVYARFKYEDSAQAASESLNSRWYAGRPIYSELSPVTDFREACCRLNSGEGCVRGGFCNFIHRKEPSPELDRELELATKKWLRERGRDERSVSRSASPEPSRPRY
jgi:splicing factor U2AF subunit